MNDTLDEQLCLHDAAGLCSLALLRPGSLPLEEVRSIIGLDLDRAAVLDSLATALQTAWPDRVEAVGDLEVFLTEARTRIIARLEALAGQEDFVPAARWTEQGRDILLEYLRLDVAALVGGVRAEGLWSAFPETPDTAPLYELVTAGMMIKLRAVGGFLVLPVSRHTDELTAAQFFSAGAWERARDTSIAEEVLRIQKLVHKQVAHLTISRPLPEEIGVYRPSSYLPLVEDLLTMLQTFTTAVDQRLLPEWWQDWFTPLRQSLYPADWP